MTTTVPASDRFAHLRPRLSATYILRLSSTLVAAIVALKVGAGYVHLCDAGSRAIEWTAVFVVPGICLGTILTIKRLWLGIPIAVLLIIVSKLLCQPYLNLIHGPNNPWPALM